MQLACPNVSSLLLPFNTYQAYFMYKIFRACSNISIEVDKIVQYLILQHTLAQNVFSTQILGQYEFRLLWNFYWFMDANGNDGKIIWWTPYLTAALIIYLRSVLLTSAVSVLNSYLCWVWVLFGTGIIHIKT